MMGADTTQWWGSFSLDPGQVRRWRVGPLSLWLQRLEGEWRVAHDVGPDLSADAVEAAVADAQHPDLLALEQVQRHAVSGAGGQLTLAPALADRPVVTRPEKPFCLPAGAEVAVFVSSPLWITLRAEPGAVALCELPVVRPSDTWFGASTREGELCYASRTFLRMMLDNVPVRPHRATTRVQILNQASTALPLRALKLPAPHLALYRTDAGQLWTQDLIFERTGDDTLASVRLRDRRPAMAPSAERVSDPRARSLNNSMIRAFSALFT